MPELLLKLLLVTATTLISGQAMADEIRIAVASNFAGAIKAAVGLFEANSGHRVTLAFGSTGKHYAQIRNGAPFDAFFAADARRPELLEKENLAIAGSRFTYAVGKLVLWSPATAYVDIQGKILQQGTFRHLAIANPELAPYGIDQPGFPVCRQWQC
jgi:molybdate transport system substrate-binding protein